jgi:periplasmic protein TonB
MHWTTAASIYVNPLPGRRWLSWMGSGAGALGMTLILFSVMPVWLHPGTRPAVAPVPTAQVDVIRLPRPDTPVIHKAPEPPEPEPQKPQRRPETAQRPLPAPNRSLPFEINSRLTGGPGALEVPPMAPAGMGAFGLPDIFAAGDLDQPLITLTRLPPVYPYGAKQRNIQGWVKVRFVVTSQGTVERVTIVAAQPPGIFERSVIRCVSGWRFRPGTIEGRPVNTWAETTVKFELK